MLKDNQSHINCCELRAPLKAFKFHQSSSCAWGSASLPHCTGKFYPWPANTGLNCQKMTHVLATVSWVRVTEQSRAHHNTEEGNLSLEENRGGWHSTPSSLMHPFSCVHSSVTGTGCFTDTATSPGNRDILTQHWHSTKWAFLFSYCKRGNWLHQTEIRACFPTSFSPVLH